MAALDFCYCLRVCNFDVSVLNKEKMKSQVSALVQLLFWRVLLTEFHEAIMSFNKNIDCKIKPCSIIFLKQAQIEVF